MEKIKTPLIVLMGIALIFLALHSYSNYRKDYLEKKEKEEKNLQTKIFEAGAKLGSETMAKNIIKMSDGCQVINISLDTGTSSEEVMSQVVGLKCVESELKKQGEIINKLNKQIEDNVNNNDIQDNNN